MSGSSASPMRSVVWAAATPLHNASAAVAAKTVFMDFSHRVLPRRGRRCGPLAHECINPAAGPLVRRAECRDQPLERRRSRPLCGDGVDWGQFRPSVASGGVAGAVIGEGRLLDAAALDRKRAARMEMTA